MKISRSQVREYAFMFLYQLEIHAEDIPSQRKLFLEEYPISDDHLVFFDELVQGVFAKKNQLDKTLEPFLVKWKVERLPKIDLTILRLALFEMTALEEIPTNVSISEAVRLAKKYSGEEAKSYINAVLGNINRQVLGDPK